MEWLSIIIPTVVSGIFGGAVATYIKTRPQMKLAELQGEAALWKEIADLKAEAKKEREECHERIANLEAAIADLHHDLRSETATFDAFLLLAEANPEQVISTIPRIREERRQHKERMAMKRGLREGTKIAQAGKDGP